MWLIDNYALNCQNIFQDLKALSHCKVQIPFMSLPCIAIGTI